ncbi:MAG: glycosyltransferase family 4 protein [Acidobacteria bacterium]|nr:glycosyltransferase family 4 protein [Acidobacteriota bacterium]
MRVWLAAVGEPLPIDRPGGERPLRMGLIARELARRGHAVTWWTSTFDHAAKRQRFREDRDLQPSPGLRLVLLRSRGYRRNICVGRLLDHRGLGLAFRRKTACEPPPDAVLASLPPLEMPWEACRYARRHRAPFFVNVSDTWPDAFFKLVPPRALPVVRLLCRPFTRMARQTCAGAAGILSISRDYLAWGLGMAGRERRAADGIFPLGYDPVGLSPGERARLTDQWVGAGVDPGRFVCCFFGTFSPLRDVETVIEAARVLERAGERDFQFVLCGGGDSLGKCRIAAAGTASVLLPGWVEARDIAVLMGLSKAGLVPYSRRATQSLPNKPFEYFSAGLPVLSSLGGELAELVEESRCGLPYEPGDVAGFLGALRQLRDDEPGRRAMGERARGLFEERFSARVIYPALVEHLERCVSEHTDCDGGVP